MHLCSRRETQTRLHIIKLRPSINAITNLTHEISLYYTNQQVKKEFYKQAAKIEEEEND